MDLLIYYDVTIQYHLDKANVVTHALSRKAVSMDSIDCLSVTKQPLAKKTQTLESKKTQTLESKFIQLVISEKVGC